MRVVVACGVLCLLSFPVLVHAQDSKKKGADTKPASKCEIDLNSPAEMFSAALYLRKATEAKTDTAEQNKDWKAAIGALSAPGYKNPNPGGYAYIVGQALVTLGTRPGAPESAPRSTYGYKDNPTGTIDPAGAPSREWDAPVVLGRVGALRRNRQMDRGAITVRIAALVAHHSQIAWIENSSR